MLLQNFNYMPDTCFFSLLCSFLYFLTFHSFLSIILKYILSFFFPDQEHFYTEMPSGGDLFQAHSSIGAVGWSFLPPSPFRPPSLPPSIHLPICSFCNLLSFHTSFHPFLHSSTPSPFPSSFHSSFLLPISASLHKRWDVT